MTNPEPEPTEPQPKKTKQEERKEAIAAGMSVAEVHEQMRAEKAPKTKTPN